MRGLTGPADSWAPGRWEAHMPPAISKQPAALTLKQQLTRVSGSLRLDGGQLFLAGDDERRNLLDHNV